MLFLVCTYEEYSGEIMLNKIIFAMLIVSLVGCTALKKNFGTGEETPELKAARAECRSLAEKKAMAKYDSGIKQEDYNRLIFDNCMEKKGYNKFGRKVK